MPRKPVKKKRAYVKPLLVVLAAMVVIGGAAGAYFWHHHNSQKHVNITPRPVTDKGVGTAPTSTPTTTKGNGASTGSASSPSSGTPTSPVSTAKPNAPYGTFVSNHTPGQNGSPLEEASVCNTSPGVSCDITFTQNGTTKSLGAKTTDSSGAAYWSWTPQSVGLAAGSWKVTAVAGSGELAITADPTALEISQ